MRSLIHEIREALSGGGRNPGEATLLSISNFYLCYYVLSSILDIILIALHWDVNIISTFFSFAIIFFTLLMFLLFLSPKIPKKFFLLPLLYIPLAMLSSLPIFLLTGMNQSLTSLSIAAGQLVIGTLTFVLIKISCGNWLLQAKDLNQASFSGGYLLRVAGAAIVLCIIFTAGTFGLFTFAVKHYSSDFVKITPLSVQFAQKTLSNGDKQVVLCGMSHIASKDFYDELKKKFQSRNAVILSEGARDKNNLLHKVSNYKGMASMLGQTVQPARLSEDIPHKNADLDISEFSKDTIECLNWAMSFHTMLDSKIDSPQKMLLLIKNQKDFSDKHSQDPGKLLRSLEADLVEKRNNHLFTEISSALSEYETVIVPWGVWHMPGVEQMLKEKGFVCKEKNYSSIF